MKVVLTESMTKVKNVVLSLKEGPQAVDIWVWCHVENGSNIHRSCNKVYVDYIFKALKNEGDETLNSVAERILQHGDINAVEIFDATTGNGIVVYSNWP